ncbi:hypothetical protein ABKN59_009204 [Abortiporus biennis]
MRSMNTHIKYALDKTQEASVYASLGSDPLAHLALIKLPNIIPNIKILSLGLDKANSPYRYQWFPFKDIILLQMKQFQHIHKVWFSSYSIQSYDLRRIVANLPSLKYLLLISMDIIIDTTTRRTFAPLYRTFPQNFQRIDVDQSSGDVCAYAFYFWLGPKLNTQDFFSKMISMTSTSLSEFEVCIFMKLLKMPLDSYDSFLPSMFYTWLTDVERDERILRISITYEIEPLVGPETQIFEFTFSTMQDYDHGSQYNPPPLKSIVRYFKADDNIYSQHDWSKMDTILEELGIDYAGIQVVILLPEYPRLDRINSMLRDNEAEDIRSQMTWTQSNLNLSIQVGRQVQLSSSQPLLSTIADLPILIPPYPLDVTIQPSKCSYNDGIFFSSLIDSILTSKGVEDNAVEYHWENNSATCIWELNIQFSGYHTQTNLFLSCLFAPSGRTYLDQHLAEESQVQYCKVNTTSIPTNILGTN